MNENVLREAVRFILCEKEDLSFVQRTVLQKIDNGPYHMMPIDELDDLELNVADELVMRGLVKFLPASARFPERLVLSTNGSHALDTFVGDTLRDEEALIWKLKRQARSQRR